jgi:hypothetical protein
LETGAFFQMRQAERSAGLGADFAVDVVLILKGADRF